MIAGKQIGDQARWLRRSTRRLRQTLRYGSLAHSPIFFANSFPKSGTHLLTQVLQGFARIGPAVDSGLPAVTTFDGFTGRQRGLDEIMEDLRRFLPGDIGYGHVHAFPEVMELLSGARFATYFILRDPRDVVVSHVHYIAEMAPNHIHHRYYHEVLLDFDERLRASIVGVPVEELMRASDGRPVYEPLPDIRQRFEPYLDWLDCPAVLVLRYEEFVANRRQTLEQVLDHALQRGFKATVSMPEAINRLEDSIDPARSPTFRSGKIGGWKNALTQQHQELFAAVCGDLLAKLGYE